MNVNIETVKVYKGAKDVIINKEDYPVWKKDGWLTSSDRQKGVKVEKPEIKEVPKESVKKETKKEVKE